MTTSHMPADFNKRIYILPKLTKGNYNTLMKLLDEQLSSDPVKFRVHVLSFYKKHGWRSTVEAFGVGKSTLYEWKKVYEKSGKKIVSLVPRSTRPKNTRVMMVDWRLVEFIKSVREEYGSVSKYKLKVFVDEYARSVGIATIGVTSIGKVIKRKHFFFEKGVKVKRKKVRSNVLRIRRTPKEQTPGYIEMDCILIYLLGKRYCFVTAIDIVTKYAWCKLVKSISSLEARNALIEFRHQYGQYIRVIQTDNGSEFLGSFEEYLGVGNITHQFIYPRSPKINGVVERFNRTIQEEFLQRQDEITYDKDLFKEKLTRYLIWYNTKRPHQALKYKTPTEYLNEFNSIPECM